MPDAPPPSHGAQTVASPSRPVATSLLLGVGTMLPVVMGDLAFKRRWAGYAALVVVLTAIQAGALRQNPVEGVAGIVISLIPVFAIRAGGLLALVVTHMTILLGQMLPVGLDWSHWLTAPVWIPALTLAAMACLAARGASAGRSLNL